MNGYKYCKIFTCALYGINGIKVDMEVSILPGLSSFEIVGLGDSAIKESRNRVIAAIKNNGYQFPQGRVTVSLAPAFLRKEGTAYDLPLAIGILSATRQIKLSKMKFCLFGEMTLSGEIKSVPGAINRIITSKEENIINIIIPFDNGPESFILKGVNVYCVKTLKDCIKILEGGLNEKSLKEFNIDTYKNNDNIENLDIGAIIGQQNAIRGLEIAMAGKHNIMLYGSPGCGKTTIAKAIPGILPEPFENEIIEIAKIYSSKGIYKSGEINYKTRPFRAPHHSSTTTAMAGGGHNPNPGEISLAHSGVLFLDEINKFSIDTIDILRQPIEQKKINIIRNKYNVEYPSDFILVGAMNPCKCGNLLERDIENPCRCSPIDVKKYQSSISGPILDRIDIHIQMQRVSSQDLNKTIKKSVSKDSENIKQKIKSAWDTQFERCIKHDVKPTFNSQLSSNLIFETFEISNKINSFAINCSEKYKLSVRGYQSLLRVARSIADYEDDVDIKVGHIAQAIQYRRKINE